MKNGVFTKTNIWIGAILGGPLAGGYYLYKNFKIFNELEKAKWSLKCGIIFTILIVSLINVTPPNIPRILIPVISTGIFYIVVKIFQEKNINEYIKQGRELAGWFKTILLSLSFFLITLCLYSVPIVMKYFKAQNSLNSISNIPKLDLSTVSKEYGIQKIHYNADSVDENDIDKTATILYSVGIFNDQISIFVYVNNENDIYTIYFNDKLLYKGIMDVYKKFIENFPNKRIKIKFFDKQLDSVSAEIYYTNY
jgi:hypothetical protein